ncbi:hypothetical protein PR202_ga01384 [Eleusine coracana subsp. coracana]|uniref:DNA-directed RNA polymerase n=1 Tax=Eleusine coracana subsp. coracana TaxID=191504 RepID=A0AAV5BGS9_ELECO|nr:hypothetical protein PR202_ga01384 [Eleusine coracana subsp. coracana]
MRILVPTALHRHRENPPSLRRLRQPAIITRASATARRRPAPIAGVLFNAAAPTLPSPRLLRSPLADRSRLSPPRSSPDASVESRGEPAAAEATYPTAANEKEGRANSIIRDVFIAHVPVNNGNFRPKCIYTAVMLRRMMDAILNADTFDDKDYVGNKRLELSGQLISLLFEDLFKTTNHQAVDRMNKISDKTHSSPLDFSQCYSLGVEDLSLLSGEEIHASGSFLVMFNGLILGKHRQPQRFANAMRKLRRSGKIGEFVSIFVNEKQDGIRSFDDFLRDGLIEYLDVNEENNALIALYEHVDQDDVERSKITHIEIEPLSILGVVSGLIPYPHHNQSPHEINVYNLLQLFRADSLLYLLVYAQRPLLTTKTIELVGYDKLGAGQNATVAVMGYSGYDIEDAIVMNKSSLDRGFGRCIAMKKYTVLKDNYGEMVYLIGLLNPKEIKMVLW